MQVTVILHGWLASASGADKKEISVVVPGASTVRTVAQMVGIAETPLLVLVNGATGSLDSVLHDDDVVELIPPTGGG